MKIKITLLSISFFLIAASSFAQKKTTPKSIISSKIGIKKYHDGEELRRMQKGQLLDLYVERIEVLANILPYIAFATKPGVTMSTLGIPNSNDNRKALDNQIENTANYVENTIEFQKVILPYSDTRNLVSAVLFYEDIMKSIHTYDEYN
ncbi:hypothetical protein Q4Q34_17605 [Flavivirga abyssicola]|uniref:Uncharacterized protein n=1 Tax=Flavivirga rizhaonensis TaxID=2559571 RepID=A0A4S1DUU3_9FLAO|nr:MULTISPECIES: hypothetical protein [Flavivirga]TGV01605.1 hypothetical protein EM932_15100 [Flavivirga rizhaonensis]WVK13033.1 hypothetical protein Q4Q34_17605 [Flavivirga sp. MEBiC07777]